MISFKAVARNAWVRIRNTGAALPARLGIVQEHPAAYFHRLTAFFPGVDFAALQRRCEYVMAETYNLNDVLAMLRRELKRHPEIVAQAAMSAQNGETVDLYGDMRFTAQPVGAKQRFLVCVDKTGNADQAVDTIAASLTEVPDLAAVKLQTVRRVDFRKEQDIREAILRKLREGKVDKAERIMAEWLGTGNMFPPEMKIAFQRGFYRMLFENHLHYFAKSSPVEALSFARKHSAVILDLLDRYHAAGIPIPSDYHNLFIGAVMTAVNAEAKLLQKGRPSAVQTEQIADIVAFYALTAWCCGSTPQFALAVDFGALRRYQALGNYGKAAVIEAHIRYLKTRYPRQIGAVATVDELLDQYEDEITNTLEILTRTGSYGVMHKLFVKLVSRGWPFSHNEPQIALERGRALGLVEA